MSEPTSTQGTTSTTVTEAATPQTHDFVVEAQGLQSVTEAELRGEDLTTEKPVPSEPLGKSTSTPEEPKSSAEPEPSVTPPVETDQKVPKGLVKLEALHEVRGENKYLKEQIAKLTEAIAAKPTEPTSPPEPDPWDNFKELSEVDFKTLAEERPSDALLYVQNLNKYQQYQLKKAETQRSEEAYQEYLSTVYSNANRQMEEIVPGIFEPESEAATSFKNFALELGFNEDLFYLTNPSTQVILPGESKPVILGEQAAQLLKVLASARTMSQKQTVDPASVEALKASLRTEIETEILSKIKSNPTSFKSLSSVPTSNEDRPEFKGRILNDQEFSRLTEKEQELYLSGE